MPPQQNQQTLRTALVFALCSMPMLARAQATRVTRTAAIQEVLSRSPRATTLVADTSAALATALSARALPNPTLSAIYTKDTPNYHVTADYPLDFFWQRGLRVDAAQLGRDAARYRYVYGRALIVLDVDTAYTRALATREKSRLSTRTAQDADSLRTMAVARRNAGDASELDVQLATVSADQQANVAAADSLEAVSSLLDLQALLGLSTDRPVITLDDSLGAPPEGSLTQAGMSLPVAAADAALRAATLSARLQRRSVWSGTGFTFGVETGDPGGQGNALLPTFGFTVPLPFFDRNRGNILAADAERQRAESELALTRIETEAVIARATRERANAVGRIDRDRTTVAAANQVASMSLTAYREGAMALPNVLEAQRTAREAISQYIDDLAAAWIATASLRAFSMTATGTPP
jgi:cobalt-zinc-cadmium efflux system outer membrane protein